VTIRGGGIIFPIGFLLLFFYRGLEYPYFLVGLLLISFISFLDDIKTAGKKIRMFFHLTSVALLFYQLGMYSLPFYWILLAFVFVIGTINAVNFMDGINGITGGYALVTMLTLYYVNNHIIIFTDERYLIGVIAALMVFNVFNFRRKAKCFAGDVGSVSIAFIIAFFLLQLTMKTHNPGYLLLLLVYGLDSATTILFRILRKENILEAHRGHFYQFLANEKKVPHLLVAALYALSQGVIDIVIVNASSVSIAFFVVTVFFSIIAFILVRLIVEGTGRLLSRVEHRLPDK
jgi:UDP-N-acetylmuramyl pentapeptide phosphotransferase/UDP-N-acetylglucosamine-1-phosphate transferase